MFNCIFKKIAFNLNLKIYFTNECLWHHALRRIEKYSNQLLIKFRNKSIGEREREREI